jgi:hypothetical protein
MVLRNDECSFLVLLFFVIFWSESTIVTWKRKNIKEKRLKYKKNQKMKKEPPTCRKSLTNFIT